MIGRFGELRVKYLLDNAAPLIVTEAVPEFVTATVSVFVLFTVTLPNARLVFPNDKLAALCCWVDELPALTPWHPDKESRASKTKHTVIPCNNCR